MASSPGLVRRRGRVLAGAAAAVALAAVVTIFMAGHDPDRSDPLEVAGRPTTTPAPAVASALRGTSPSLTSTADATAIPGSTPGTAIGDLPSTTSTPRAPRSRTATSSPTPTHTTQPSPTTPSSGPVETPAPAPAPPPTSPTSAPTPTPTPTPAPCSVLEHLLGLC